MNEFDRKRSFYNRQVIKFLEEYLTTEGKGLRFSQLMSILYSEKDYFFEEPKDTLVRFQHQLKQKKL